MLPAGLSILGRHFVEADGGLKHEQYIEAVLADILHDTGDLFSLDHRLMDGHAELLDEFAHSRRQAYLQERRPARTNRGRGVGSLYLTCLAVWEHLRIGIKLLKTGSASVAATIITE